MSIDWSKAPEGATHFVIGDDINPWRKIKDTVAYEHYQGAGWLRVNSFNEGYMPDYYVPIPQETWDGQGLPPVGTVCEYRFMAWTEYRRCEIRYISDGSLVVYDDGQERFYRTLDTLFRPIRTPEQITAEEREKAISEMLGAFNDFPWPSTLKRFCKVLYDAGYRKHVE